MSRFGRTHLAVVATVLCGCPDFVQAPGEGAGDGSGGTTAGATRGPSSATDGTRPDSGATSGATTSGTTTQSLDGDTSATATASDGTPATDGNASTGGSTDGTASEGTSSSGGPTNCVSSEVLAFDGDWEYFATNLAGFGPSGNNALELTPDDETFAAAAVFYSAPISMPYRISFEMSIEDDNGAINGDFLNSGDGISVMLNKDSGAYDNGDNSPPSGGARGFREDGTGWGVHFETWSNRRITVRNGANAVQTEYATNTTYTGGAWTPVEVNVAPNEIAVRFDGVDVISFENPIDGTYPTIGFGAGTGAADSRHAIRNVTITCVQL